MANFDNTSKTQKIDGDLLVTGDLFVTGTTVTLSSTTFETEDNNIVLNKGGTAATAVNGGFTIEMSDATDVTLLYTSGALVTSIPFGVASGQYFQINGTSVLNATTLGSGITGSSLTSLGTLSTLTVDGGSIIDGPIDISNTNTGDAHALRMVGKGINLNGTNITNGSVITATTFSGALTGDVTGTILTAAQPNITSVGTLTSLDVSGTITAPTMILTSLNVPSLEVSDDVKSTFIDIKLNYSGFYDAVSVAEIIPGSTGYTVNDVLTIVGGIGTSATLTVTSVDVGEIDGISITTGGEYSSIPANPVSVTGGTGSGATFNLTIPQRNVAFTLTEIPNTGSLYKKTYLKQSGQVFSISTVDVDDTGTEDASTSVDVFRISLIDSSTYLGLANIKWPNTDGTIKQVLTTDGAGVLSFQTIDTATFDVLLAASNLSDIANVTTARSNLGLGSMALETDTDYYTKTAADSQFLDAASNLSDIASVTTARSNLGLGSMALETDTNYYTKTAADSQFLDAASNLSDLTNVTTARSNLGLGSMALETDTDYYTKTAADSQFLDAASNLLDIANVTTARSNLGLGSMALETDTDYYTKTAADSQFLDAASNLLDIANATTARTNLGVTATGIDTTYVYRANNLSDLANAATAKTNIGLGTGDTPTFTSLNLNRSTGASILTQRATSTAQSVIFEQIPYPVTTGWKFSISTEEASILFEAAEVDSAGAETATPTVAYLEIATDTKSMHVGEQASEVLIRNIKWPTSDGNNRYVLSTNGSSVTTFNDPTTLINQELIDLIGRAVSSAAIVTGGSGYNQNDVLTITGGAGRPIATLTVTSVNSFVIDGITVTSIGSYHTIPANPVSVTGGTGSGATFNLTWSSRLLDVDLANRKIGLGQSTPLEKLHLDGAIVVSGSVNGSPVAGTIRYDGVDFQGYDGVDLEWKSFTNQLATQAWMNTSETVSSATQTVTNTVYVELTSLARSLAMKSIVNDIRIDTNVAYSLTNVSGINAMMVVKRCEGAQTFATGTIVREISIASDTDIGNFISTVLDTSGNTSVTYRFGIKVANASDTFVLNPATTHPGPSTVHVTEFQPSSLQLLDITTLGAGANIYESTVSGIARLRSITNADGHMTITQGATEIDIGLDTIDGGTY